MTKAFTKYLALLIIRVSFLPFTFVFYCLLRWKTTRSVAQSWMALQTAWGR